MKITVVQGAFLPVPPLRGGAVEKVWFALGGEFARRGNNVRHISRMFPSLPLEETINNVHHFRVRGFDAPSSLILLKLYDLIYSLNVVKCLPPSDILVTNTFWLPIVIRSKRLGCLYVHVARYPKGQMKCYKHAARLQTVSRSVSQAIIAEGGINANMVQTIPYPILNLEARNGKENGKKAKQILFVGRLHPEKGLSLLIEAVLRIPESELHEWQLIIVGPAAVDAGGGGSAYEKKLHLMAAPLGSRIKWVGPVFDPELLNEFYAKASLFVYPSLAERGETFGLAPLEAMSRGCPALVSNLSCFTEFLEAEVDGYVFNHRSESPAQALADKMCEVLQDPAQLALTAAAAQRKAQNFSVAKVSEMYLRDFESILNRGANSHTAVV